MEIGMPDGDLWCWERLLRVPWTERRPNQSILKKISPEYSLEGLMLKFQYFGYLMWRTDTHEKTLMLGKIEGGQRRGWQRMRWLDGIMDSMDMSLSKLWGVGDEQGSLAYWSPWGHKVLDTTEQLNWTDDDLGGLMPLVQGGGVYIKNSRLFFLRLIIESRWIVSRLSSWRTIL